MSRRAHETTVAPEPETGVAGPRSGEVEQGRVAVVLGEMEPEAVLDKIRELVGENFRAARQLAIDAAGRFPGHTGLENAKRVLATGGSRVVPGPPGPSRADEFAWLRNPPSEFRGKWVALDEGELIGSADTLDDLVRGLSGRSFDRPPLVHRVE